MRAGAGLLVLLITIALMLYLYTAMPGSGNKSYLQTVATANKEMKSSVNVWNGMDTAGEIKVEDSVQVKGENGVYHVTAVTPGGPADVRFGLLPNDRIVKLGEFEVRDTTFVNNLDDVMLWLREAYTKSAKITVERDGKRIELPTTAHQLQMQKSGKSSTVTAPLGVGVGSH